MIHKSATPDDRTLQLLALGGLVGVLGGSGIGALLAEEGGRAGGMIGGGLVGGALGTGVGALAAQAGGTPKARDDAAIKDEMTKYGPIAGLDRDSRWMAWPGTAGWKSFGTGTAAVGAAGAAAGLKGSWKVPRAAAAAGPKWAYRMKGGVKGGGIGAGIGLVLSFFAHGLMESARAKAAEEAIGGK